MGPNEWVPRRWRWRQSWWLLNQISKCLIQQLELYAHSTAKTTVRFGHLVVWDSLVPLFDRLHLIDWCCVCVSMYIYMSFFVENNRFYLTIYIHMHVYVLHVTKQYHLILEGFTWHICMLNTSKAPIKGCVSISWFGSGNI